MITLSVYDIGIDVVLKHAIRLWISPNGDNFRYEMPTGSIVLVDNYTPDALIQARIDYAINLKWVNGSVNLHPNFGKQWSKI